MRAISKIGRWNLLCSLLFIASAAFSITGYFAVSIASLCLGFVIFKKRLASGKSISQPDSDTISFLNVLISEYSKSKNLILSLETASKGGYVFSGNLMKAIARLRDGMPAGPALSGLKIYNSVYLNEMIDVIGIGLETGCDIEPALDAIRESAKERDSYRLKTLGAMENAITISQMGGAVFFPLFAGISLDIIRFTNTMNNQVQNAGITSLFAVFAGYLIITNYSNSISSKAHSGRHVLTMASLLTAVGMFLFTLTSNLAFTLIGG
ncbi:MAG: hypothetical protein LVQ95_04445 [Candidatus Micrarchaeales archaeon]|nr:hypothetical protein [Candidatus Micrarchaeales archaeon]